MYNETQIIKSVAYSLLTASFYIINIALLCEKCINHALVDVLNEFS